MGKKKKNHLNAINNIPEKSSRSPVASDSPSIKIMTGEYTDPNYPMSDEVIEDLARIFELTDETDNPNTFIKRCLSAIEKYPNLPQIRIGLYSAYKHTGLNREYRRHLRQAYKQFPDAFMVKLDYARFSIEEDRPQRIPEIFDRNYEIYLAFPDREEFHVDEVLCFYEVMTKYFLAINSIRAAQAAHRILEDIAPDNQEVRKLGLSIAAATIGL